MFGRKKREKIIEHLSPDIPLGLMGSPIDVAYAAIYLASDESSNTTGI